MMLHFNQIFIVLSFICVLNSGLIIFLIHSYMIVDIIFISESPIKCGYNSFYHVDDYSCVAYGAKTKETTISKFILPSKFIWFGALELEKGAESFRMKIQLNCSYAMWPLMKITESKAEVYPRFQPISIGNAAFERFHHELFFALYQYKHSAVKIKQTLNRMQQK